MQSKTQVKVYSTLNASSEVTGCEGVNVIIATNVGDSAAFMTVNGTVVPIAANATIKLPNLPDTYDLTNINAPASALDVIALA